MRLLISCLLVSATFAITQHSFFTVQGHGSNAARIQAHLERTNLKENVQLSTSQHQKTQTLETTTETTSTLAPTTERQTTAATPSTSTTTLIPKRITQPEVTRKVQPVVTRKVQPVVTRKVQPVVTRKVQPVKTRKVQPIVTRTFKHKNKPSSSSSSSSSESQITGILKPEEGSISNTLFSSVMIDILPEIQEFTERLDKSDGSHPEEFASAVSDLTNSFVKARAEDEGRNVTEEEKNNVKLTEAAFDITLGLVKDLSETKDITSTMKKMTDIVPRLAHIAATARGRELSDYEIEDIKNANEMVEALSPFFTKMSSFNFGNLRSGSGSGINPDADADFIQDFATQNLRNIQDFTNSNSQNFRDYNRLQSKQFSTQREQEYFRNNVRRVQEFARNNRKNVETIPARLSPNGGSISGITSQVGDIIQGTQQFLGDEPVAVRQLSSPRKFFKQFRNL